MFFGWKIVEFKLINKIEIIIIIKFGVNVSLIILSIFENMLSGNKNGDGFLFEYILNIGCIIDDVIFNVNVIYFICI